MASLSYIQIIYFTGIFKSLSDLETGVTAGDLADSVRLILDLEKKSPNNFQSPDTFCCYLKKQDVGQLLVTDPNAA